MLLQFLLTLMGGRTVTQIKKSDSGNIYNKTSVPGVIIALFLSGFSIYSFHVTAERIRGNPDLFREPNNIMRTMIVILRTTSLIQQSLLAFFTHKQSKNLIVVLNNLRKIDEYLECHGVKDEIIVKRIRVVENVAVAIVFTATLISALSFFFLFDTYYKFVPTIYDFYINVMPRINYLVHILVTCVYLYAVRLRFKLHNAVLEKLNLKFHNLEMKNRFWNTMKRKYLNIK